MWDFRNELTPELIDALNNPMLVNNKRQIVDGAPGENGQAIIDPSTYQGNQAVEEFQQAANFSQALIALNTILTGHENLTIQTFKESVIASSGAFIIDEDKRMLLVSKKQAFIGKGSQKDLFGKPGGFMIPDQRLDIREHARNIIQKQIGWRVPESYLRGFGPDIVIPKVDYDTTYRNNCYGIIFAYVFSVTSEEKAAIKKSAKSVGTKITWKSHHSMEEMHKLGRLTLNDEWPYINSMYRLHFKLWHENALSTYKNIDDDCDDSSE